MSSYQKIPSIGFSKLEDQIISFWKENKIFEKSVESRPAENTYSFIDGPPFVSGMPHYGHLLSSIAKDIIPRFWTMKGKRVRRVFGWDCHGLPIEAKVNEKYGIKTAKEVEETIGVAKYVAQCREYVEKNIGDWRWYIEKIGRWVDLDHPYKTMDPEYGESVMWAFKQIWDKGLIYKGKRTTMYSTDTQTPVSGFEVAMDPDNYQDTDDTAVFIGFKINELENTYLVAWTTTPWTLASNFGLAINPTQDYVLGIFDNKNIIIAQKRVEYLETTLKNKFTYQKTLTQADLVGLSYQPLYSDLNQNNPKDYHVYAYDNVTMEDGTGVLHLAPAFGEEDYLLGKKFGLSDLSDIDSEGTMTVGPAKGKYLRGASKLICDDLTQKGNLLGSHIFRHRLPYFRGRNPLIYWTQESWFIDVQKIKSRMLELNQDINWVPDHIKEGRMAETIKSSPDWNISRNRFWATIMPLWVSESGKELVIGSYQELSQYNPDVVKENETWFYIDKQKNKLHLSAHRDICDQIVLTKDGEKYHRIPEVLDCWMDSGSVPFAEYHYPFENEESFKSLVPADFIVEYVGQVRAWFNVLLRFSTILYDKSAFTNVICTGTLGGNDGRKMSKTYGNYPDPKDVLENTGGDAVRLYLLGSPLMSGEDAYWSDELLRQQVQTILIPLQNIANYLVIYGDKYDFKPTETRPKHILNKWIRARTDEFTFNVNQALTAYNTPETIRLIQPFLDNLSSWYIRRSRDEFNDGSLEHLQTLYDVLFQTILTLAPVVPFITETIYQNIFRKFEGKESIHLFDYPLPLLPNDQQEDGYMSAVRQICTLIHEKRQASAIKIRQPLSKAVITFKDVPQEYKNIILDETNLKSLDFKAGKELQVELDTTLTPQLIAEGEYRDLLRSIQSLRKVAGLSLSDTITIFAPSWPKDFEKELLKKTLASSIQKGDLRIEKNP